MINKTAHSSPQALLWLPIRSSGLHSKMTNIEGISSLSVRFFTTQTLSSLRHAYIRNGVWVEKKEMNSYLIRTLQATQKYVDSVKLSSSENEQFQSLRSWYEKEYIPQTSSFLPFHEPEAVGKTFEVSGGDYLNREEINCYLTEGVVGPIKIPKLSKSSLEAIQERFQNFHSNHNRNLGSVYTMLSSDKCMFELATNSTILAKVSSILGDNIMLANMTVNALPPGHGKSTVETNYMVDSLNCHSDLSSGSQYHFEIGKNSITNLTLDNRCVNVWVSISGTNPINAPLYFFPKTHLWEIPTPFTYLNLEKNEPDRILRLLAFKLGSAVRRIGLYNEEYKYILSSRYKSLLSQIFQTEIYTQPGECILFNAHAKHGSGVNCSSKTRLAITMRYNTAMSEAGGLESAGSVVTLAERKALGLLGNNRKPMIQVLGNKHHENNIAVDISHLRNQTVL